MQDVGEQVQTHIFASLPKKAETLKSRDKKKKKEWKKKKKQRHYLADKSPSGQGYGFSVVMYGCES